MEYPTSGQFLLPFTPWKGNCSLGFQRIVALRMARHPTASVLFAFLLLCGVGTTTPGIASPLAQLPDGSWSGAWGWLLAGLAGAVLAATALIGRRRSSKAR